MLKQTSRSGRSQAEQCSSLGLRPDVGNPHLARGCTLSWREDCKLKTGTATNYELLPALHYVAVPSSHVRASCILGVRLRYNILGLYNQALPHSWCKSTPPNVRKQLNRLEPHFQKVGGRPLARPCRPNIRGLESMTWPPCLAYQTCTRRSKSLEKVESFLDQPDLLALKSPQCGGGGYARVTVLDIEVCHRERRRVVSLSYFLSRQLGAATLAGAMSEDHCEIAVHGCGTAR